MAHITHLLGESFTGHIGPVRFTNGHAETDDADMVAYFAADPYTFDVVTDQDALGTPEDPPGDLEDPDDTPED